MPNMWAVGSLSIEHTTPGWVGLLVIPSLPFFWYLLSLGYISADLIYANLMITSIALGLSGVFLGIWYYYRSRALESGADETVASALVNDKAFFVACIIVFLALFSLNLTVFFTRTNLPVGTNVTKSWQLDNSTFFTGAPFGVERLVIHMVERGCGFLLSVLAIYTFFMPWAQMGAISASGDMESLTQYDAPTTNRAAAIEQHKLKKKVAGQV